jgi:Coenzyme PQQ synthesis protein D (PqqD)
MASGGNQGGDHTVDREGDRGSATAVKAAGARWRASEDAVGRHLGDMSVVVNVRTNRIYELNLTGSVLWDLIEAGADRQRLEQAMLERFDVGEGELARALDEALALLVSAGLVIQDEG